MRLVNRFSKLIEKMVLGDRRETDGSGREGLTCGLAMIEEAIERLKEGFHG